MSFAKKMIELRKQNGLSQQDLADRLGVSRQAISRWETGAVQPLADSVKSLATTWTLPRPRPQPSLRRHPRKNPRPPGSTGNGSWHWRLWLLPLCWSWSRRWVRRTISNGRRDSRCLRRTCCRSGMTGSQTERSQSHGDSRKEVQRFVLLYKTQIP